MQLARRIESSPNSSAIRVRRIINQDYSFFLMDPPFIRYFLIDPRQASQPLCHALPGEQEETAQQQQRTWSNLLFIQAEPVQLQNSIVWLAVAGADLL